MSQNDSESKPAAPAAPVELVRKIYAKDLREKDRVHTVFRVAKKSRTTARSGKSFLMVGLQDRTGELDARVFDKVDEVEGAFSEGDYLLVEGNVIAFHGKPQLVIDKLEKLDPEPIDPAEFTPAAPAAAASSPNAGPGEEGRPAPSARDLLDRVHDQHLKALLRSLLELPEVAEGFRSGHGPKGTTWAHRGGLGEHLASYARLAGRIAEHFPAVDRDLVIAGAIAQQIGRAFSASDRAFESTDRGRLVGAGATAAQLIYERARALEGFPPLLEQHLSHLALGGPPATLEALVLKTARELDERMGSWLSTMSRDAGGGHWTDPARNDDGALWKGPAPTSRGRAPVDAKAARPPKKKEKQAQPASQPAPKMAFKPLAELAPGEPAAEAAPPAPAEPAAPETPTEGGNPEG